MASREQEDSESSLDDVIISEVVKYVDNIFQRERIDRYFDTRYFSVE
jgi:hypothetical protein